MSDNTRIQLPSDPGDIIATEDIGGGVKIPRSKLTLGDHGVDDGDISAGNPMPVSVMNDSLTVALSSNHVVIANPDPIEVELSSNHVVVDNVPDVHVTNTPDVNVANTPDVHVTNVPDVHVTNTPDVNVANTPDVNITNTNPILVAQIPVVTSTSNTNTGAEDSDVNIGFGAIDGATHVISGVAWSYSGGTPTGRLTIGDGYSSTYFDIDIVSSGPGFIPFEPPLAGGPSSNLILTLYAGGGSTIGKINAMSHWIIANP